MKNFEKSISLQCSICGNDQFSTVDDSIENMMDAPDETEIKCSDCGRIVTKEQLIQENQHIINANIEDLKEEAIKQLKKDLKKIFK
jgi:DNA-directed RNA polymerase subunit RPC12/RpoP